MEDRSHGLPLKCPPPLFVFSCPARGRQGSGPRDRKRQAMAFDSSSIGMMLNGDFEDAPVDFAFQRRPSHEADTRVGTDDGVRRWPIVLGVCWKGVVVGQIDCS